MNFLRIYRTYSILLGAVLFSAGAGVFLNQYKKQNIFVLRKARYLSGFSSIL